MFVFENDIYKWLRNTGVLASTCVTIAPNGGLGVNEVGARQIEAGHTLYNLLLIYAKRLNVNLSQMGGGEVPKLDRAGMEKDAKMPVQTKLFNWTVVGNLLKCFGYDLESDVKTLIVAGDDAILSVLLREVHDHLTQWQKRAQQQTQQQHGADNGPSMNSEVHTHITTTVTENAMPTSTTPHQNQQQRLNEKPLTALDARQGQRQGQGYAKQMPQNWPQNQQNVIPTVIPPTPSLNVGGAEITLHDATAAASPPKAQGLAGGARYLPGGVVGGAAANNKANISSSNQHTHQTGKEKSSIAAQMHDNNSNLHHKTKMARQPTIGRAHPGSFAVNPHLLNVGSHCEDDNASMWSLPSTIPNGLPDVDMWAVKASIAQQQLSHNRPQAPPQGHTGLRGEGGGSGLPPLPHVRRRVGGAATAPTALMDRNTELSFGDAQPNPTDSRSERNENPNMNQHTKHHNGNRTTEAELGGGHGERHRGHDNHQRSPRKRRDQRPVYGNRIREGGKAKRNAPQSADASKRKERASPRGGGRGVRGGFGGHYEEVRPLERPQERGFVAREREEGEEVSQGYTRRRWQVPSEVPSIAPSVQMPPRPAARRSDRGSGIASDADGAYLAHKQRLTEQVRREEDEQRRAEEEKERYREQRQERLRQQLEVEKQKRDQAAAEQREVERQRERERQQEEAERRMREHRERAAQKAKLEQYKQAVAEAMREKQHRQYEHEKTVAVQNKERVEQFQQKKRAAAAAAAQMQIQKNDEFSDCD